MSTEDRTYLDLPEGTVMGSAQYVGNLEDGSNKWHEQRATVIGGSEVASILEVPGAFDSAHMLWLKKAGKFTDEAPTEDMARLFKIGHLTEPVTAALVEDELPYKTVPTGSWVKADAPWHGANPDRFLVDDEGAVHAILELKYSARGAGWENGFCPEKYVVQLRWYLDCFGLQVGYLAALDGGNLHLFEVPLDETKPVVNLMEDKQFFCEYGVQGQAHDEVEKFWNTLPAQAGSKAKAPALRFTTKAREWIGKEHPEILPGEVELKKAVVNRAYRAREAEIKAKDLMEKSKGELMELMGDQKAAVFEGVTIATRQARGQGTPFLKFNGKPYKPGSLTSTKVTEVTEAEKVSA